MRYYVFPDIHGCYTLLEKALEFVYTSNPDGGKIIFLGDYIDRGPSSKKVLEIVMNPPASWEFITLKGNHEDMFIGCIEDCKDNLYSDFYDINVLKEFSNQPLHTKIDVINAGKQFPTNILNWMENLKLFHIEDNNVFAHAYYNPDEANRLSINEIIWYRMSDSQGFFTNENKYHLTHGHTPRHNGPIESFRRTNLDCGVFAYDRFVIGEYHKDILGPVKFHEFVNDKLGKEE